MIWVDLVTILALLQFAFFGFLVGAARMKHGVRAPAQSGHELFDRAFRVHMNTLETLVMLLPSMYIAARYNDPRWAAALGAVYLVGRMIYRQAYVRDPQKRSMGYSLSFMPAAILAAMALVGIGRALLRAGGAV